MLFLNATADFTASILVRASVMGGKEMQCLQCPLPPIQFSHMVCQAETIAPWCGGAALLYRAWGFRREVHIPIAIIDIAFGVLAVPVLFRTCGTVLGLAMFLSPVKVLE